jgi:16S rRNA (adenine1518-N6/adenine1519-N6)-dimethyltransferase
MGLTHKHKKSFGQHFLVDRVVIEQMLVYLSPKVGDNMLEIGPGAGALTEFILARIPSLHAVELDKDLIEPLNKRFLSKGLVLHHDDALIFDYAALFSSPTKQKWRIFGNLPYNVSSPLLFCLFPLADQISDQFFMLQKEVVDRMCAQPATADYGRLSVMMQARYHLNMVLVVEPSSFNPPPKVRSAVVSMTPHQWYEGLDWVLFEKIVKQAFSQRRKMLRNTLSFYHSQVPLEKVGVSPQARAEEVSVDQYVAYTDLWKQTVL